MAIYLLKVITERDGSNGGADIMSTNLAASSKAEPLMRLAVLLDKVSKPADSCNGEQTDAWTDKVAILLKSTGIAAKFYPEWDVGINSISFHVTEVFEII